MKKILRVYESHSITNRLYVADEHNEIVDFTGKGIVRKGQALFRIPAKYAESHHSTYPFRRTNRILTPEDEVRLHVYAANGDPAQHRYFKVQGVALLPWEDAQELRAQFLQTKKGYWLLHQQIVKKYKEQRAPLERHLAALERAQERDVNNLGSPPEMDDIIRPAYDRQKVNS